MSRSRRQREKPIPEIGPILLRFSFSSSLTLVRFLLFKTVCLWGTVFMYDE